MTNGSDLNELAWSGPATDDEREDLRRQQPAYFPLTMVVAGRAFRHRIFNLPRNGGNFSPVWLQEIGSSRKIQRKFFQNFAEKGLTSPSRLRNT
jgi:hypothetical protein